MDSRTTIDRYRRLSEGLLRRAIEAPKEQNNDFLRDALRYLTHARTQEEQQDLGEAATAPAPESETQKNIQHQYRQVRQLIKQALEAPTPEEFLEFLDFTTKFRRLSVWNAYMARIQRPGAHIIATEHEWKGIGRHVVPDAIPIMILWPFSPIRMVYEVGDTGPPLDALNDSFAVRGEFRPIFLSKLTLNLKKQKTFKITIEARRQGSNRAGSAAMQGYLWNLDNEAIGKFAEGHATSKSESNGRGVPAFRITVNDLLQPSERFVTIAHELAHIFCGHLGPCASRNVRDDDESGWPDRRKLNTHEMEVEAEATAFQVASRAGLVTRSAAYLAPHVRKAGMAKISLELVVRAAARIERLAKIRYGSMDFG